MSGCAQCGAHLSPEDLVQRACRYCGAVLAHELRAAEKAATVRHILNELEQSDQVVSIQSGGRVHSFSQNDPQLAHRIAAQVADQARLDVDRSYREKQRVGWILAGVITLISLAFAFALTAFLYYRTL